jgi:hypothetical protein
MPTRISYTSYHDSDILTITYIEIQRIVDATDPQESLVPMLWVLVTAHRPISRSNKRLPHRKITIPTHTAAENANNQIRYLQRLNLYYYHTCTHAHLHSLRQSVEVGGRGPFEGRSRYAT